MSAIFISHNSRDNALAGELERRLSEQGHNSLYLDFHPELGTPGGRDWEHDLYTQLRTCRAVIVIITEHSMNSSWCFAELTHARALGKTIIPLKAADCEVNSILSRLQIIDLTVNPDEGYQRLWRALREEGVDWDNSRPPYPGLLAFQREDAAIYFGRETEVQDAVERFYQQRRFGGPGMIMLLGASGSGKSSLLRAGILPRLATSPQEWLLLPAFRPGTNPRRQLISSLYRAFGEQSEQGRQFREEAGRAQDCEALVEVLGNAAADLRASAGQGESTMVLAIDQFEELLGYSCDEEAAQFFRILSELSAHPGILLVATMRSDFLGALQEYAPAANLSYDVFPLAAITQDNILRVIEGPAQVAGVELEAGLSALMLDDVKQSDDSAELAARSSDALPLLAFALRELYERYGDDHLLTLSEYRELGGLHGAVARAANAVFSSSELRPEQAVDLRWAFLNMVRINAEGHYVRQPAKWCDMPDSVHDVLEVFVQARLLVSAGSGEDRTLEVAHESLFRAWKELRLWLDQEREFLLWRRRLANEIATWEQGQRTEDRLMSGPMLDESSAWLARNGKRLSPAENKFCKLSIDQQTLRKRRARRRLIVSMVLLLFIVIAMFALWRWAVAGEKAAFRHQQDTLIGTWMESDPTRAVGMLLEVDDADQREALRPLLRRAMGQHLTTTELSGHAGPINSAVIGPSQQRVITAGSDGSSRVWFLDQTRQPLVYAPDNIDAGPGHRAGGVAVVAPMPDGRAYVSCGGHGLHLNAIEGPRTRIEVSAEQCHQVSTAADGKLLAAIIGPSAQPGLKLWRLRKNGAPEQLVHLPSSEPGVLAFSPDSSVLAVNYGDGVVDLFRTDAGSSMYVDAGRSAGNRQQRVRSEPLALPDIAFSADGSLIISAGKENEILLIRRSAQQARWYAINCADTVQACKNSNNRIVAMTINAESALLQLVLLDGTLLTLMVEQAVAQHSGGGTPEQPVPLSTRVLMEHQLGQPIDRAVFNDQGTTLLYSNGRRAYLFDTRRQRPLGRLTGHAGEIRSLGFNADGTSAITASQDGTARVWAPQTLEPVRLATGQPLDHFTRTLFNPDGSYILASGLNGVVLWSLDEPGNPQKLSSDEPVTMGFTTDGEFIILVWQDYTSFIPLGEDVAQARHIRQDLEALDSYVRSTAIGDTVFDFNELRAEFEHGYPLMPGTVDIAMFQPKGAESENTLPDTWEQAKLINEVTRGQRFLPGSFARLNNDGSSVLVAHVDGSLRVWPQSGANPVVVLNIDKQIIDASFSADSSWLLAVTDDGRVLLAQADGAGESETLAIQGSKLLAARFHPDGSRIHALADDGHLYIWSLDTTLLYRVASHASLACLPQEFRQKVLQESEQQATTRATDCRHQTRPPLSLSERLGMSALSTAAQSSNPGEH